MARRLAIGLGLGLAAALLAGLAGSLTFAQTLEWKLYDLQLRRAAAPERASRELVVVRIDERSIRELEPFVGRWPWPRLLHAKLVEFLARAGARAVLYDVLFTERDRRLAFDVGGETWSGEESDRAFAEAVRRAHNVVLLADVTFEPGSAAAGAAPEAVLTHLPKYRLDDTFESRPAIAPPYPGLAEAAQGVGHNLLVLDPDGPVRRYVPFVRVGDAFVPSLSVAGFLAATATGPAMVASDAQGMRLGSRSVPLLLDEIPRFEDEPGDGPRPTSRRGLIDFLGPAVLPDGRTTLYQEFSALDLLQAQEQIAEGVPPAVDPAGFRDRIVVVGVTAAGLHDVFAVPFSEGGKMPGAIVHATVVDQLLASRFREPARTGLRAAAVVAMAVVGGLLTATLSLRWAGLLVGSAALAAMFLAQRTFERGVWLPAGVPLAGLVLASVGGLAYRYLVEGQEKRAVKRLFSRYLSKDVYEQLLANPSLAELGGARREMSVLFSDIRGFTSFTERGTPEAVVSQLNEYFSTMVDVVFQHRGTLDKFVGDMVMALFGAPLEDKDHADHAVAAALQMLRELDRLNAGWTVQGKPALGIGIGINSGPMIAGNIGSARVQSYTVIGDAVNLGSRLESLNKQYGTTIIISEGTASRLRTRYDLRPLGSVIVKGKTEPVTIFEVRVPPTVPAGTGGQAA